MDPRAPANARASTVGRAPLLDSDLGSAGVAARRPPQRGHVPAGRLPRAGPPVTGYLIQCAGQPIEHADHLVQSIALHLYGAGGCHGAPVRPGPTLPVAARSRAVASASLTPAGISAAWSTAASWAAHSAEGRGAAARPTVRGRPAPAGRRWAAARAVLRAAADRAPVAVAISTPVPMTMKNTG